MNFSDTLGFKQNNVGNLRGDGVKWLGKTGMNRGFSVFSSRIYGIRAIYVDLIQKIKGGKNTIEKIITVYAPPIENDTKSYIDFVEKRTGISKTMAFGVDLAIIRKIVKAIAAKEIGYNVPDSELNEAEKLIGEKKNPSENDGVKKIIAIIVLSIAIGIIFKN